MTTDLVIKETIYSVSELNQSVRLLLEEHFQPLWVEGEISNFVQPNSGHWYFSLKDTSAQVRCAMFRGNQRQLAITPENGMRVLVKARVSLYENRGEFQLIIEAIEERGIGQLHHAFERLKKKLENEGLFDISHKQSLPSFPKRIGVITSPTGAAIRDILTVLKRRYPCVGIIIYPAMVQGAQAAPTLINAIKIANQRQECDVLILARGGGSLEDLWPFNEESVARAIYDSQLPLVSGIGHEIDFTIADFVADQRAPTPSAAAEIVTPNKANLISTLNKQIEQIKLSLMRKFTQLKQEFTWIKKHLLQQHPQYHLNELMQKCDYHEKTFISLVRQTLINKRNQLNQLMIKLETLNPDKILKRGFSITTDIDGKIIKNSKEVNIKSKLNIQLACGSLVCSIDKITSIN